MRRTATDRWMEAAEANRFRRMALQMPALSLEQEGRLLAGLVDRLRSMVRPEIMQAQPARSMTRSPAWPAQQV
jgi:hypothetical protein